MSRGARRWHDCCSCRRRLARGRVSGRWVGGSGMARVRGGLAAAAVAAVAAAACSGGDALVPGLTWISHAIGVGLATPRIDDLVTHGGLQLLGGRRRRRCPVAVVDRARPDRDRARHLVAAAPASLTRAHPRRARICRRHVTSRRGRRVHVPERGGRELGRSTRAVKDDVRQLAGSSGLAEQRARDRPDHRAGGAAYRRDASDPGPVQPGPTWR